MTRTNFKSPLRTENPGRNSKIATPSLMLTMTLLMIMRVLMNPSTTTKRMTTPKTTETNRLTKLNPQIMKVKEVSTITTKDPVAAPRLNGRRIVDKEYDQKFN